VKRKIKISEAEWEVMRIVWNRSPLSAQEITEKLSQKRPRHPKTIRTLINRLVKKGALGHKKMGKAFLFLPLMDESKCAMEESISFLDRVFGGSLHPMIAQFIEHQKLSAEEIQELQKILREKK